MSIKACQKVQITYGITGWDSPIGELVVENKTLCAEDATEERASTALTHVISEVCNDTTPKHTGHGSFRQLQKCDFTSPVTVAIENSNWFQRVGIKISDLWNRVF